MIVRSTGKAQRAADSSTPIRLFYWDRRKNFGDLIAPWLVSMMTGRPTINVKGRSREAALATVGSIIPMFDRPGLHVWGSGMLHPLSEGDIVRLSSNAPARIYAVRGARTRNELTRKLGWEVPRIYGDPALLLPRFFTPKKSPGISRLVVVPHYSHKPFFSTLEDSVKVVSAEDHPEQVVTEIAGASVCVSTSLHGLIVAHAYAVPWVWLEIAGYRLSGSNFKFDDFFTVLETDSARHARMAAEDITASALIAIASKATLPRTRYALDELQDVFPHDVLR